MSFSIGISSSAANIYKLKIRSNSTYSSYKIINDVYCFLPLCEDINNARFSLVMGIVTKHIRRIDHCIEAEREAREALMCGVFLYL